MAKGSRIKSWQLVHVRQQDTIYRCHLNDSTNYPGFLRFQQITMLRTTKIPRTTLPPTAEPITIPLSFPLIFVPLSPGPLLMAELEDTAVIMA